MYILTKHMKLLCALFIDFEYAIEFNICFLFEYCSYFSSPHMWVNNKEKMGKCPFQENNPAFCPTFQTN